MTIVKYTNRALIALLALVLVGCGDSGPVEITRTREFDLSSNFELPQLAESDASRFRFKQKTESDTESSTGSAQLTWRTPDGWKQMPTSSMREANLRFGENDEGECYVTRLSGMGGGLAPNVNRWRKQMGAAELTEEEVAALPKKTLFGQDATLVSVDGTYSGMGAAAKGDSRLHGLILNINGAMVTVKMTGPKELVSSNESKFDAFCASLDVRTK